MSGEYSRVTLSWTINAESEQTRNQGSEISTEFPTTSGVAAPSVGFPDSERVPLWVPYVVLTTFLLILVVISFVRFHRERGAQNRERLEAMADQQAKEQQTADLFAARKNGSVLVDDSEGSGVHPAASELNGPVSAAATTPSSSYVPAYLDLFLTFSESTPVCTIRVEIYLFKTPQLLSGNSSTSYYGALVVEN